MTGKKSPPTTARTDSETRQSFLDIAKRDGMTDQQAERMADDAMGDLRMVRLQAQTMEAILGRS